MLLLFLMPVVTGYAEEKELSGDGSALYARFCAGCHRPLDRTFLTDRSAKRIRSAIDHLPAMRKLRHLSESELVAIAAVLTRPPGYASESSR